MAAAIEKKARALQDVLNSTGGGQPFPGKYAVKFAAEFARLPVNYAQCVNTGTVAIQAAFKASGIQPWETKSIFRGKTKGIPRAAFVAALQLEYIDLPRMYCCPESERAAYHEAVWFRHQIFMGTKTDVETIADAIHKLPENIAELRDLDHKAIRNQRLSRADRES